MSELPIKFQEHAQLTSLGVPEAAVAFNSCTLESDKYVCVREVSDSGNQVAIIDIAAENEVTRRAMTADSAIISPASSADAGKVLALRAQGRTVQVVNLDTKQRIKHTVMTEDVVFWKWLSGSALGLVTDRSIYTWDVTDPSQVAPLKLAGRHASLLGTQIINLQQNATGTWLLLNGIAQEDGGRIVGKMQLYSKNRNISQAIEGHAGGFGQLGSTQLFSFVNRGAGDTSKLHVVEIDHQEGQPAFTKKQVDFFFPPEAGADFPVALSISSAYGIAYVVTKFGFIHLYDVESGAVIFMNRISSDPIFTACALEKRGIMVINRKGQVLSVELNEDTVIQYALTQLNNAGLALALASRAGFPGADNLYTKHFEQLLAEGSYTEAAKIAAASPNGLLRTPATIQRLKAVQAAPGEVTPILVYFSSLLDHGTLNSVESIDLATPVLQQGRKQLLEKWIRESKLTPSEQLGDLIKPHDSTLALAVYLRTGTVPFKVVQGFVEVGEYDKIVPFCQKSGYKPDFVALIQGIARTNPDRASEFAQQLVSNPDSADKVDLERLADIFLSQNLIQQATALLLDALKDNKPEQGHLQTRLLEANLVNAPQVADAILGNGLFTRYDRKRVATLAEKAGLIMRSLENFDDVKDIKRVITGPSASKIPTDWLVTYFGQLTVDQTVELLREMLKSNTRGNLQTVVQVASKYADLVGAVRLIGLFEDVKSADGIYLFLQSIVNLSDDPVVVFKYIQAAASIGQFSELQRIISSNNVYNPEKVKNFLKDAKLADQLPLITLCDRFNFTHELVLYLYQNNQFQFIQVYVQQVNPSATPQVIAGLIDVDCDEDKILTLLDNAVGQVPVAALATEVEQRNRLKLLLPFLEKTIEQGSTDQAVFDTLAKVYIDSNNNPEKFLKENDLYNTLVVGKYCESRDPYLAFICYEKGQIDAELIAITNENSMYKYQARYLVKRSDLDLWATVLDPESIHRRQLVDQVIGVAVPESPNPEEVSVIVKAFMAADMPVELTELLEKIIFEPSPFSENPSLQNLLILTTIKAKKSKVSYLVDRLDHYNVDEISRICVEHGLTEEAHQIFVKHNRMLDALEVLTEHIMSLDRAAEFAENHDTPELWSALAKAQLSGLRVSNSIESYIRAKDPSNFNDVIDIAKRSGKDEELVNYLNMARQTLREPVVDGQLIICYAQMGKKSDLNDLVDGTNVADLDAVGDELYSQGLFEAARKVYTSVSNWAKLASTLVHINDYQGAVDAARKASSTKVWRQVFDVCLEKKEFRLAQMCGLSLIINAEELRDVVDRYVYMGSIDELTSLLEQGLALERAHMGMFTELAVVYAKFNPEKLMEYLNLFWSRLNMPKVIRVAEEQHLWPEVVFLYCHYDEFDNASLAMMEHSADAFDHNSFKEIVVKVSNLEIYYKAISYYMSEQPQLISDLLSALTPRLDVSRVVKMFQKSDNLPMIKPFLVAVQDQNNSVVNSAFHDLLIEEEDYKSLRSSVDVYDRYDSIGLAQRLEKHDLVFFRQIAAHIYAKNKKWTKSIALSKEDKLWKDAIKTAAQSGKPQEAEDLLRYFIDIGNKECYVATLYACYELLQPDVVEELSWRHNLKDFTMPYFINQKREQTETIAKLQKAMEKVRVHDPQGEEAAPATMLIGYTY